MVRLTLRPLYPERKFTSYQLDRRGVRLQTLSVRGGEYKNGLQIRLSTH
jgi:hypothetical protein